MDNYKEHYKLKQDYYGNEDYGKRAFWILNPDEEYSCNFVFFFLILSIFGIFQAGWDAKKKLEKENISKRRDQQHKKFVSDQPPGTAIQNFASGSAPGIATKSFVSDQPQGTGYKKFRI